MASAMHDNDFDFGDDIDRTTFDQILEMDEDDHDREFSYNTVFDFFRQAESVWEKMDTAIEEKDFNALSELGKFLKGSAGTLGFVLVRDECRKIENLGKNLDENGQQMLNLDTQKRLALIDECKMEAARDAAMLKAMMKKFYGRADDNE